MSMNPGDPNSFNHRTERLSTGRTYHFVDQRPAHYTAETPTLLCLHGFPDLWYGWRHQIGPWVRRGYRVIAPDMLGYGGTDKPTAPEEYSMKRLSDDMAALLDIVGVRKAVVIGHDWGSYTAGRFALWHPDRLRALAMLSVPYNPPIPVYLSLPEIVKRLPNLGYQLYLASDASTKEVEANLDRFLRLMYSLVTPDKNMLLEGKLRQVLFHAEGQAPAKKLLLNEKMSNMNGPLSYYRTTKARFDEEKAARLAPSLPASLPVLHIYGSRDKTTAASAAEASRQLIPRLELVELDGVGHWVMLQAKEEITEAVGGWLERVGVVPAKAHGKL
ncbi:alpha/beta-hydrolase [Auriscalpium vulgare]|uniref:Alpha/beta-hydrolase n=1 Tax=Auriscalpium vulgare TaxID=40419 RepID=A0ACB8RRC5_9AGAM|nr:alpha/beta-hydrolase [Auriscalpium vulgare]